jgi:hypothetical protein
MWCAYVTGLAEAVSANTVTLLEMETQVTSANAAILLDMETKVASADLVALQTQVDALPTAEDLAAKADADDVTTLQTQQAINTVALTALESHGTEGAPLQPNYETDWHQMNSLTLKIFCTHRSCTAEVSS